MDGHVGFVVEGDRVDVKVLEGKDDVIALFVLQDGFGGIDAAANNKVVNRHLIYRMLAQVAELDF